MNYKKLYNELYNMGYHGGKKNHGIQFVKYLVSIYNFETILDVGCSQGITVQTFCNRKKKSFGIDISEIAIKRSKELEIKNCYIQSAMDIKFKDNKFDAVFSCDTLEHLEIDDIKRAISEMIRVSKRYLFIKIFSGEEGNRYWINLLHKKKLYKNLNNLHLTLLSVEKWINLFLESKDIMLIANHNNLLVFEKRSVRRHFKLVDYIDNLSISKTEKKILLLGKDKKIRLLENIRNDFIVINMENNLATKYDPEYSIFYHYGRIQECKDYIFNHPKYILISEKLFEEIKKGDRSLYKKLIRKEYSEKVFLFKDLWFKDSYFNGLMDSLFNCSASFAGLIDFSVRYLGQNIIYYAGTVNKKGIKEIVGRVEHLYKIELIKINI